MAVYSVPEILHSDDVICDACVCSWGKTIPTNSRRAQTTDITLRNVMWKVANDTGEG